MSLSREAVTRARADGGCEVLSRGGSGNPDVVRIKQGDRDVVVKDFSARGPLVRRIAPWLVAREVRAYRQLAGHPSVPRLLARIDSLAFALEYRPGEIMGPHLARRVPSSFLDELRVAVDAMHARGVVHLDLRHRSNTLADADGHPVLIDFASALCFRPGGWAAQWILPLLARMDLRAIEKWKRQLTAS